MKKQLGLSVFLIFSMFFSNAQNELPSITSTNVVYDADLSIFTIEYTFTDSDSDVFEVEVLLSDDGGKRFDAEIISLSGDVGDGIDKSGTKTISLGYTITNLADIVIRILISDKEQIDIQTIVDQVDSTRLLNHMLAIEGVRHRTAGLEHLVATRDYIVQHLTNQVTAPEEYAFNYSGFEAINYISTQEGLALPNEDYYVGGHYDSVDDSPAADDNGTAIAAMLEIAEVMGDLPFNRNLRYVAWDLEEEGLIGSLNYVNNVLENPNDILGYLNFEMIGYYTEKPGTQSLPTGFNVLFPEAYNEIANNEFKGDFLTNVGNEQSSLEIMNDFESIAAQYVPALNIISIASPGSGAIVPDLQRSDHAAFWGKQIPSIMLTDGANFRNPNYHTANDTVGSLNMTFLWNNTKAAVAYLAEKLDYNHAVKIDIEGANILLDNQSSYIDDAFRIYPSPAGNIIYLDLEKTEFVRSYDIYNEIGQLVQSNSIETNGARDIPIEVGQLSSGVYTIQLLNGSGAYLTGRFVIER